ncbi:MAG: DUF4397 domain-containing protein [Dinghuibacter sp.]|nr:DUF4397 domain-containing protein [Dinghuibacter sp.]
MRIVHIAILLTVSVFSIYSSCTKKDLIDENRKWEFPDEQDVGMVRFYHNYSGKTPALPGATSPSVFLYANGAKLNGNGLGYAGSWPSPNDYATVKTGATTFLGVLARLNTTVVPNIPAPIAGDTVLNFNFNVEKGKFYSVFLVDTAPSIRALVKEENFVVPELGKYKIRLVNLTSNITDSLNLYSRNARAVLIPNITHKQVSDFIELPLNTINDTLEIRRPGGTSAMYFVNSQTAPQPFFPTGQRIYTVVCRGKTASTPNNTPSAGLLTNR